MKHQDDVVQMVDEWTEFGDDRAYILMAIARRKFNRHISNSSEVIHRRVLTEDEDVPEQVADLMAMIDRHDLHFRLYLTVNAHDTVSAYHSFVQEAVGWSEELHNGHEGVKTKFGRVSSEWKSVLHSPEHRVDQHFLFDLDDVTEEEACRFEQAATDVTDVVGWKQTPNGYHIVTRPFDYTTWEPPVEYDEMDTDGMVNVIEIDNRPEEQE